MSRYNFLPVIKRVVKSKTKTLSLGAVQFEYLIIQKRLYIILYRVAQKKVYAFDFVQRKNYKCYVPQINVILSRKA